MEKDFKINEVDEEELKKALEALAIPSIAPAVVDEIKKDYTKADKVIDDLKVIEDGNLDAIDDCIGQLKRFQKQNSLGMQIGKMSKAEISSLSSEEFNDKLIEQLSAINLKQKQERQEFFKYISGFKSSTYSYKNSMLLYGQSKELGVSPVFATMKEWNKQKTTIKSGSKALLIRMPSKFVNYYEKNEDGLHVKLPTTFNAKEIAEREKRVKNHELKKREGTKFYFNPVIFSIDQTTMPETERIEYLQRFNGHNTSEENAKVLEKEKKLCDVLGIKVNYTDDMGAALGFITYSNKIMVLHEEMPVDAQISVITHEVGHYLFHRHESLNKMLSKSSDNIYALDHANREIQAQLFSHIVLEGLGVDSESEYSLKYINSYLSVDENTKKAIEISDVSKSVLNAHLSIVTGQANKISGMLSQEEFTEKDIKQLYDFMPDRYLFDKATNKAQVILNDTIEAQEKELAKAQKQNEVKNNNIQNNLRNKTQARKGCITAI